MTNRLLKMKFTTDYPFLRTVYANPNQKVDRKKMRTRRRTSRRKSWMRRERRRKMKRRRKTKSMR